jgi:hypothetical protein
VYYIIKNRYPILDFTLKTPKSHRYVVMRTGGMTKSRDELSKKMIICGKRFSGLIGARFGGPLSHYHAIFFSCFSQQFCGIMKKQIILLVAMIASVLSAGATGKDSLTKIRNWTVTESFHTIVVNDDVDVMLIEDPSAVISVEGLTKFVDAIQLQVKDGKLIISSTKHYINRRAFVFIPVRHLESIVVKGNSEVNTIGALQSSMLQVYIENDCLVSIRNNGQVKVENNGRIELEFIKNGPIVAARN